jgi:selenide, water dikinase
VAAKPLGAYAERWAGFRDAVEAGRTPPDIAVIGAGVGGVELALAMDHRLREVPGRRITLIERQRNILPELGPVGSRLRRRLDEAGIAVLTDVEIAAVEAAHVRLADGRRIPAALTLGAAGSRPQPWLAGTGLHLTDGYVTVGATLASVSHPNVFAAGDCAHLSHAPRPKAGVFAVRAAPILAHNLRAVLSGGAPRRFRPQHDYLKLVSLGEKAALAGKWGMALEGAWLWRLKDRIDRAFHAQVSRSAGDAGADGPAPGCFGPGRDARRGAALRGVRRQDRAGRPASRVEGSAAAARRPSHGGGRRCRGAPDGAGSPGHRNRSPARRHRRPVADGADRCGACAGRHLGDGRRAAGGAGQRDPAALSEALQERTLAEIMAGAAEVMSAAGASIAGGHSTMGAELTIGFTVTGRAEGRILTKSGARPGDALILTKPVGSGTLLAAEMQKRAVGRDIAALWPVLTQSQGRAAAILAPEAHAMTDVTGFGLAGHLDEMLRAGEVAADLELAAVPLMAGAEALAAAGIASTIAPANRAALIGRIEAPKTPRAALLFDPQTAGGLLAAVPADAAEPDRRASRCGVYRRGHRNDPRPGRSSALR